MKQCESCKHRTRTQSTQTEALMRCLLSQVEAEATTTSIHSKLTSNYCWHWSATNGCGHCTCNTSFLASILWHISKIIEKFNIWSSHFPLHFLLLHGRFKLRTEACLERLTSPLSTTPATRLQDTCLKGIHTWYCRHLPGKHVNKDDISFTLKCAHKQTIITTIAGLAQ